jgi:two-component system sensor histidine kinase MprB
VALRKRVGVAAGVAVGLAVLLAVLTSYFVVRSQLLGQVDDSLRSEAAAVAETHNINAILSNLAIPPSAGGPAPYVQLVTPEGVRVLQGYLQLPVTAATQRAVRGQGANFMSNVTVGHSDLRVMTIPVTFPGYQTAALQIARPLDSEEHILAHLRIILLLVLIGGIALAVLLGRLAAERVLSPLAEVTQTAELIARTDDLSARLRVHADDEVGQLATRFNTMLERLQHSRAQLDASVHAQRQLVADASHELRTPVTSLRTNVELLLASERLDPEEQRRMLADVVEQSEELTALVHDLIDLARGDLPDEAIDDVRLDHVVEDALARARRNFPHARFEAQLQPVGIEGAPDRLHRAVNNLLDNAARHSPDGGLIEVRVDREGVIVRDHGSGIDPRDLPHVFDRFYRGENSRGRQGSGLGLAIVRQVTEQHGGRAEAANAPGGGAVFTLRLPAHAPQPTSPPEPSQPAHTPLF